MLTILDNITRNSTTPENTYYTGVGSRTIPDTIYGLMFEVASILGKKGFTLRSGGASGSDSAFEEGCHSVGGKQNIWKACDATQEAIAIAAKYHKAWTMLDTYAKKLHGRNAFQVLGDDLKTPSDFVICYTADGCLSHAERTKKTGGTGTAISIADQYKIPIINLALLPHLKYVTRWALKFKGTK